MHCNICHTRWQVSLNDLQIKSRYVHVNLSIRNPPPRNACALSPRARSVSSRQNFHSTYSHLLVRNTEIRKFNLNSKFDLITALSTHLQFADSRSCLWNTTIRIAVTYSFRVSYYCLSFIFSTRETIQIDVIRDDCIIYHSIKRHSVISAVKLIFDYVAADYT